MLDRLPESAARRQWSVLPASIAIAVHGAIVLGVVELRAEPGPPRTVERLIPPFEVILAEPSVHRAGNTGGPAGSAPILPPAPRMPAHPVIPGRIEAAGPGSAGAALPGAPPGRVLVGHASIPIMGGVARVTGGTDTGLQPPELLPGSLGTELEEARRLGLRGTVVIRCIVDTSGIVEPGSIEMVSGGDSRLTAAATRALEQARFRPGRSSGVPVRVQILQRVRFAAGIGE